MRALFYTTVTTDCRNHVEAWNSISDTPAVHLTYQHNGMRHDYRLTEAIREYRPYVCFYIGAHRAPGNPLLSTLLECRKMTKMVNLCSDAADRPWHSVLHELRSAFDLQVAIDGASNAPVDLSVLTPVDWRTFSGAATKDIRWGFSGMVGHGNTRSEIIRALEWFGDLTVLPRTREVSYQEHANFMKRCRIIVNVSKTGTGGRDHIKGRVLEAGWAECALFESEGSPIGQWFPEDCFFLYKNPPDAVRLLKETSMDEIAHRATRLSKEVKERYHPRMIYNQIINALHVDIAVAK